MWEDSTRNANNQSHSHVDWHIDHLEMPTGLMCQTLDCQGRPEEKQHRKALSWINPTTFYFCLFAVAMDLMYVTVPCLVKSQQMLVFSRPGCSWKIQWWVSNHWVDGWICGQNKALAVFADMHVDLPSVLETDVGSVFDRWAFVRIRVSVSPPLNSDWRQPASRARVAYLLKTHLKASVFKVLCCACSSVHIVCIHSIFGLVQLCKKHPPFLVCDSEPSFLFTHPDDLTPRTVHSGSTSTALSLLPNTNPSSFAEISWFADLYVTCSV